MKRLLLATILAAGVWPVAARAAPYWVAWEGNDYPENEGWTRSHLDDGEPSAIRSLSDGIMTLDGLASIEIVEAYRMFRPLNPEPGEEFVVQWGLRVNEVGNPNSQFDPGLAIYSDDAWHFILVMGEEEARSILEQRSASFNPGTFHAWEFRSSDMRSYSLLLDGAVIRTGTFTQSGAVQSRISWGDLVFGSNSHSDWDYFRFGVVPEPNSCFSLLALLCAARASNLSRRIP